MRKLLGLAIVLVALPACATARSIRDVPGEALGDLGTAISGALAPSPQATVRPLLARTARAVTTAPDAVPESGPSDPDPALLERRTPRPGAARAAVSGATLGETRPIRGIDGLRPLDPGGVGLHWRLATDVTVGPAVEWWAEHDQVLTERLTVGLSLRF